VHVILLADTHVRDGAGRRPLPDQVLAAVASADLVLHAGDVTGPMLLSELEELAPTVAVLGNNDHQLVGRLPERIELDLDGVRVAMVHDSGASNRRGDRLSGWFPDADLVVFGHSHLPEHETGPGGQLRFNPGSPTQCRRAPWRSFGELHVEQGRIVALRHVRIDADVVD
jgi:putative phosphoesterase